MRTDSRHLTRRRLGVGTARGPDDDATDTRMRVVLLSALRQGVTTIDTAVNYRRGRSEKVVGEAIREGCMGDGISRAGIRVITKGGYLRPPGGGVRAPPPPERHGPMDHCLAPRCLRHQLDLSFETLGVGCIDVYLLHNPEASRAGRSDAEFDRLLLDAFAVLEDAAAEGRIGAYGIATWRATASSYDAPDVARCKALAEHIAPGSDRFRVVEAPLSLANQSALAPTHRLGQSRMSLPALCRALNLDFVASAAAGGATVPAMATLSVRWTASVPGVETVLVGTLDPRHLDEMIEACPGNSDEQDA